MVEHAAPVQRGPRTFRSPRRPAPRTRWRHHAQSVREDLHLHLLLTLCNVESEYERERQHLLRVAQLVNRKVRDALRVDHVRHDPGDHLGELQLLHARVSVGKQQRPGVHPSQFLLDRDTHLLLLELDSGVGYC